MVKPPPDNLANAPATPSTPPQFQQRDQRYLWVLLGLLMSVTIFEAYDLTIFNLCTPDIAKTFHLDDRAIGRLHSTVRFGGMMAFFVVLLADRFGRRAIVATTVLCYALYTLFTAMSQGLGTFTIFQSSAQVFLSAEFAVSTIMISEEFPPESRGRGISALNAMGLMGVVAGSGLYGIVAARWGWRAMYYIGVAPLLLVAYLRRGIKETARFELILNARGREQVSALSRIAETVKHAAAPIFGPYWRRVLLVALLWNCVGLVQAPAVTFFSLYVQRDHHWTKGQVGEAVVISYLFGSVGILIAGWAIDRFGRKFTTGILYIIGAIAIRSLFKLDDYFAMLVAQIVTVMAFQGARTATATYSTELFPTEIRGASYSFTVQLLGQLAAFATPFTVGTLSKRMGGLGNAVAIVAIGPIIGALLVWIFAPETRGRSLEELRVAEAD